MIISYPYNTRVFVDVSVTHPCASRYYVSSSDTSLSAGTTRSRIKHNKYDTIAHSQGGTFTALICETYGSMMPEFVTFIQHIITSASQTRTIPPSTATSMLKHAYVTIAFALLRGTAAMARKLVAPQPPRDIPPHPPIHVYHRHNHHTPHDMSHHTTCHTTGGVVVLVGYLHC